jgi:hypothetical protein
MAPSEGRPCGSMFMVIATMLPSSPAAYCRTEYEPFGGGGPGLYVDFSIFCFQVPIIEGLRAEICAKTRIGHTMSVKPAHKLRFIRTSSKATRRLVFKFVVVSLSD